MGEEFDYAEAFKTLDLEAVKKDIETVMTDLAGLVAGRLRPLRAALHPHGVAQRGHLPHQRRPRRRRVRRSSASRRSTAGPTTPTSTRRAACCGRSSRSTARSISWADLMVLAGNCALESMGFKTFGFGGGREDVWEPRRHQLGHRGHVARRRALQRRPASSTNPLAAVQMGLIYVNPEGPNGKPDPLAAARDIRETFRRMAMNDEETVALIAGGHTFGKTHGAADPDEYVGPEPEARRSRSRASAGRTASAPARAATPSPAASRAPGPPTPTKWDNSYFENLFGYEWELAKSPAGAHQWVPEGRRRRRHRARTRTTRRSGTRRSMLTTDLALRMDPVYEPISRRFHENPEEFADAFARRGSS